MSDMDTKRCIHCQKLQRADAVLCSRCGHNLSTPSQPGISTLSTVSILPSSPHRAGHYSGLHPEDLPYFSSKITVQRPPLPTKQPEPEHIILPETHTESLDPLDEITLFSKSFVTTITGRLPSISQQFPAFRTKRTLSALIISTCILMLLAGSLITFTLINNQAPVTTFNQSVTATPQVVHLNETFQLNGSGFGANNLIAFKNDLGRTLLDMQGNPLVIHADSQGAFSVQIPVPPTWQSGPHTIYIIDETIQQNFTTTITLA